MSEKGKPDGYSIQRRLSLRRKNIATKGGNLKFFTKLVQTRVTKQTSKTVEFVGNALFCMAGNVLVIQERANLATFLHNIKVK